MIGRVLAAAFVMSAVSAASPASAQTPVERGMKVFAEQKCSMCHSVDGKGNPKGAMEERVSKLSNDEIHEWLVDPAAMREKAGADRKPAMKSYSTLPKSDLDALVAYLASLKKK
jgi:mono/diheme cytochrome c family protein